MDRPKPDAIQENPAVETPEDVAVLYSWANLQGAKYRDFSASRREYRAQMRHRAAQAQRDEELRARDAAEAAASASEKAAREAEEAARFHANQARQAAEAHVPTQAEIEEAARARALRHANELSRQAAAERMEAARRAEAVAAADAAARREAREMAEARASAARQEARYEDPDARRGMHPTAHLPIPGETSDPYTDETSQPLPGKIYHQPAAEDDMMPARYPQTRDVRLIVPQPDPLHPVPDVDRQFVATGSIAQDAEIAAAGLPAVVAAAEKPSAPVSYYYDPDSGEKAAAVDQYAQSLQHEAEARRPRGYQPDEASGVVPVYRPRNEEVPEWIQQSDSQVGLEPHRRAAAISPVEDTLQHSRERVAARWYGLKSVFEQGPEEPEKVQNHNRHVPMVTVFSLAGGVGKTSLVATLGRTLSSMGEKVLLTDTTSHGLLPFYFGASELRPGVVRTFSPPAGSPDAPIYLVNYDLARRDSDAAAEEWLVDELSRNGQGMQRVVLDLGPGTAWVARRLAKLNSVVLVPVAPDMNSVISLGAIEKYFAGLINEDGKAIEPFYLLNQFDAGVPLHLDVREVMRRQLGDRLLPFVIRRSQAVSEALAEGMTVMDYAPDQAVAGDYMNLASWLRTQSMPAAGQKNARWSEQ